MHQNTKSNFKSDYVAKNKGLFIIFYKKIHSYTTQEVLKIVKLPHALLDSIVTLHPEQDGKHNELIDAGHSSAF